MLKKIFITLLITAAVLTVTGSAVMLHPKFGKFPSGQRLERIKNSPNYKDGGFQNLSETPQLTGDISFPELMFKFLFSKTPDKTPERAFNFTKTSLHNIPRNEDVYIWMGHSSYYLQIEGKKILIDPVLSGFASPFSFTTKAFKGADIYKPEDIPEIDYLIITHDHWDHLDYGTIKAIKPKIKHIVTGLGTGAHLEHWDFKSEKITELDWNENVTFSDNFRFTALPARHFSGRTFKRNQAIWASFMVEAPQSKIYIGGDSGYDTHFSKIGDKFGAIDLAILENGQYGENWKFIHMMPEEVLEAGKALKAKQIAPVHNSKFSLSHHAWNEPMKRIVKANATEKLLLLMPKIGEKTYWRETKVYPQWWEDYD